ncbi:four-carbon acid sugar kinase family protein [Nesterenkonia sp. CL21]|uniref:3-oxo-tetronate kinase n=1 Tax=Nesterenkonia sp. CL21 TaxID=3064894 RepID=UPI0028788A30|nr:3-oxo-tetronate kinase [Nesterenkonia sp. CL21]MDS2172986.1 four-carbon acid sugar kinase family protein [Nesterenkonia sp. CL21]
MPLRLGVIADDFTGATDIAGFLVAAGLRTVQLNGPLQLNEPLQHNSPVQPDGSPRAQTPQDAHGSAADLAAALGLPADVDAVVISLKSRSIPASEAVAQSLDACRLLEALGAERIQFKYCSTFDSTAEGNIGPVTDALLDHLGEDLTVVVPALPVNGRTVYQGNLFVHHQPLHESGMRDHPVTPMRDSDLLRLMEAQSAGRAVKVPHAVVARGPEAVREALQEARVDGARYAVIDTIDMDQLDIIGAAVQDLRFVTGGSGIGSGVARSLTGAASGVPGAGSGGMEAWGFTGGAAVVLSGSCSEMTNRQVEAYRAQAPSRGVDVDQVIARGAAYAAETAAWVQQTQHDAETAPLVYATAPPEEVRAWQDRHGAARVSAAVEEFFGRVAAAAREAGTTRFIAAGGETSGAVTQALGVDGFEVGPQIAPGVPWTRTLADGPDRLDLALKSGNFGDEDFFAAAQRMVPATAADPTPDTASGR